MTAEPNWQYLELRHQVAAAGRVIDADTKKALPGCLVEITTGPSEYERLRAVAEQRRKAGSREPFGQARCRGDGFFVFLGLPAGKYRARVTAPDAGSPYRAAYTPGEAEFTVFDERDQKGRVRVDAVEVALEPQRGPR